MANGARTDLFWRAVTLLARLDMTASIMIAAALLMWMTWHGAR
jgi:hypothetical protein